MQRLSWLWTISADSQFFHRVGAKPTCKERTLVTTDTGTLFFKLLKSLKIISKEWIPAAYVAWLAGATILFLLVS
jgi:hypothetical protein